MNIFYVIKVIKNSKYKETPSKNIFRNIQDKKKSKNFMIKNLVPSKKFLNVRKLLIIIKKFSELQIKVFQS